MLFTWNDFLIAPLKIATKFKLLHILALTNNPLNFFLFIRYHKKLLRNGIHHTIYWIEDRKINSTAIRTSQLNNIYTTICVLEVWTHRHTAHSLRDASEKDDFSAEPPSPRCENKTTARQYWYIYMIYIYNFETTKCWRSFAYFKLCNCVILSATCYRIKIFLHVSAGAPSAIRILDDR